MAKKAAKKVVKSVRTTAMKKPAVDKIPLPKIIREADLNYPKMGKGVSYETLDQVQMPSSQVKLYFTQSFGWVVCTLPISKGKQGRDDRFYAIGLDDGKVYRVGNGPHVLRSITVWLSQDNWDRLQVLVERWQTGMEAAGQIRDRISSRRAQGQMYRSQGRSSWMW